MTVKKSKTILVPRSTKETKPSNHGTLGREIKISPKSHVTFNEAEAGIKFHIPSIEVMIGIGTDHVAYLMMDTDAWNALKKGEKLDITTLKEFKKKFL